MNSLTSPSLKREKSQFLNQSTATLELRLIKGLECMFNRPSWTKKLQIIMVGTILWLWFEAFQNKTYYQEQQRLMKGVEWCRFKGPSWQHKQTQNNYDGASLWFVTFKNQTYCQVVFNLLHDSVTTSVFMGDIKTFQLWLIKGVQCKFNGTSWRNFK